MELLSALKALRPELDVILMTAYSDLASAVQALRLRAYDYLCKPLNLKDLADSIDRALERDVDPRRAVVRESTRDQPKDHRLIGVAPQMREVIRLAEQAAQNDSNILVQGESGTGNELVARSIHAASPRRKKPFVGVNCAAVVPALLESELFGHVKGAFSEAIPEHLGLFRAAEGGTVFLDEIAEMSPHVQAKLLRTLQNRCVRPVGGTLEISIDVRIFAATNRDLERAIQSGDLRKDLFYRLNVVTIRIAPLRERREDVPILVQHFMEKLKSKFSGLKKGISDEAMNVLISYLTCPHNMYHFLS